MVQENTYVYNMPLTLEKHFENLAQMNPAVKELYSLWNLLRKEIEERLSHSSNVFINYSLHDKSHCFSVMQSVERFLGEVRIRRLSATDTFMLLACIYSHDYGMAQTCNKIYDILGSSKFENFLAEMENDPQPMEDEDAWAVHNLYRYLNEKSREKSKFRLNDLYFSIMLVIQLYLRPSHWKGVIDIRNNFEGLFQEHLKKRFLYGSEGIVEICMCHGQSADDMMKLSYRADGMAGDEYHPRFVASMLRLGDLLDLDNARFPPWFVNEVARNKSIIPRLSFLHYRKHEAVSHLLITPDTIEIAANCLSTEMEWKDEKNAQVREVLREKAQKDSYDVAALVYDWTEQLSNECRELVWHWSEIAPPDFGQPPSLPKVSIYVDGTEYMAENKSFQMKMSQERVMKLLKGTNIYKDKYVGIREMIQNAIDASLLQLWSDLLQNRYSSSGLSKNIVMNRFDLLDLLDPEKSSIFQNYDITVELIEDRMREQVFIVVKDKGIGITTDDVRYMADIGSSRENNKRIRELMKSMPAWLKPSGAFGIGLQSVFQLTDCIEFYTRQHNRPEQQILLYSYGRNRGKIEMREIASESAESYYDNAVPGTNVRIALNPKKYFGNEKEQGKNTFFYYDPEFDTGSGLHMLFVEAAKACEKVIRESAYDYFNVSFESLVIEKDGKKVPEEDSRKFLKFSYFRPRGRLSKKFGAHLFSLRQNVPWKSYIFDAEHAFYWDKNSYRCYRMTVRPCGIDADNCLILPERVKSLYDLSYKFNPISNVEAIYTRNEHSKNLHAGFLKLDLLILDDHPMNYMNIDRDRLREDAIDEEELIATRDEIVRRWCEFLCVLPNVRPKKRHDKSEEDAKRRVRNSLREKFMDKPGILISLILLFYQTVPPVLFQQFLALYYQGEEDSSEWNPAKKADMQLKKKRRLMELKLKGENFKVSDLWKPGMLFQTEAVLPMELECGDDERESACVMDFDNVRRLPHRMVKVESIRREGKKLWYYFRLQPSDYEIRCVRMDYGEGARLHDYVYAFLGPERESVQCYLLIKKVFKPDAGYKDLVVPCHPKTFSKGRNMDTELDFCMNSCILSPFDLESVIELSKIFKDNGSELTEGEVSTITGNVIKKVMEGEQLKKCVSYIIRKKYPDCEDCFEQEKKLRDVYQAFLTSFCGLLAKYRKNIKQRLEENKKRKKGIDESKSIVYDDSRKREEEIYVEHCENGKGQTE